MKRLCCVLLALAMLCSLSPAVLAAETMVITKTDIRAQSVINYEGYGSITMSELEYNVGSWSEYAGYRALIDANGSFLFPYEKYFYENDNEAPYVYSEGFVTIGHSKDYEYYGEECQFYSLNGRVAIDLPDIRDEILAELQRADRDPDYDPTVDVRYWVSPFSDGVAFVREEYVCSSVRVTEGASGGLPAGEEIHRAYLMDSRGGILCELPADYSSAYVTDTSHFWAWCGNASGGLIPTVVKGYDAELSWQLRRFGYMDYSGELVMDMAGGEFNDRGSFSEGLAWVVGQETGLCGFINTEGELVIPCRYQAAYTFADGLAAVKKDGLWGAIDKNGNTVIPFRYERSFGTDEGYMVVGMDNKYGLVDRDNNIVVPLEYDDLSTFQNGVAYAVRDGFIHIITEAAGKPGALAYASTQSVEIDGTPVVLQAYALLDSKGFPTNYVKLRDVAMVLNGTRAQFEVNWDGNVNILTGHPYTENGSEMFTPFSGDRPYSIPTAVTTINGGGASLSAISLTDDNGGGYTYYQLRDLGRALGFNVGWDMYRGIFIETDKPYTDAD